MSDMSILGDVLLAFEAGKSFQTAEVLARQDELGVLKVSAVTWTEFRADEAKSLYGDYQPDERHRVRKDDLLISRANTKELVGAVVLVDRDYPFRLLSDKTLRLVINEERASKEFLKFALRAPLARKHIEHFATGTSDSMRNIAQGVITSIPIRLPPIDEQIRIAARLKTLFAEVETARHAAQVQRQDIELLRARMLREVFASMDDASRKVLGDHAPCTSGSTPSRSNKRYWEPAEVPWVKTGEVAFAPITQTEEAVSKVALGECSLTLLPPKTVLVAMYGQGKTRGQSAILEISAATNQACFAILPNDTWEPEFLYYWLIASYEALRDLSADRGGNQANLNGALLKALEIPAPEKPQQRQIVQYIRAALCELDALGAANMAALDDLTQLPQRLLAQAFGDTA